MNKSTLVTLSLSLGLIGGLSAVGNTANAASTHRGLPHILQNTKWQAKSHYITGRDHYEASEIKFYKSSIYEWWAGGSDPFFASKISYKFVGHHTYKLYGHLYGQAAAFGSHWSSKVKFLNSRKIYYKDYNETNRRGSRSFANKVINVDYNRK